MSSSSSEFSSSASASSFVNLRSGGCNDILNPTAPTSTTTTDAGAAIVLAEIGQQLHQHQRGRLQQCQMFDGNNVVVGSGNGGNIGTRITATTRRPLFHRRHKSVNFTMTSVLLLPITSLLVSYTTALVHHSGLTPTHILARRVANVGKKISILSTTSSSLFYKLDTNDSYSDPAKTASVASANANTRNGGEEEGNISNSSSSVVNTNHSPLQFARAKRARKLHRHPSKKAKKKSGKESTDDIIVELLPSTFADDYFDDDEQTPFILSEPGEGETWVPPLPSSSSSSSTARTSATTTSESCSKLDRHPALVLNADYQPLRMLPLSIWSWQDTIKAVLSGKAVVVDIHPNIFVRAVSLDMPVPSVIALREYAPTGKAKPAFTRRNVFLRDGYRCQYCSNLFRMSELSLDHVEPRCMGGKLTWENTVTCCMKCNGRKGCLRPSELYRVGMELKCRPKCPTLYELAASASNFVPRRVHPTWAPFLGMSLVGADVNNGGGGSGGGSASSSVMSASSSSSKMVD
ncbi:hypothetical protein ACHAXH_002180 [Discostella pseudostelligera]